MEGNPEPARRTRVVAGCGAALGRTARLSLAVVLLCAATTGCARLALHPADGMARIEAFEDESLDFSRPHPADDVSDAVGWVPGLDILSLAGEVAWRNADPRDTAYTETLYILEVDGRPVTPSAEGVEVPAGEHSLLVQYCRSASYGRSCSAKVDLTFVAEADTHYRLIRSNDFEVLVVDNRNDRPTVARSEATVAIARDEKVCIVRRNARVARTYRDDPAEKARRLAAVKTECRNIWSNAEAPKAPGVR